MRREDDRFFFIFFFPFFPSCCPHARRGAAGRPWPRMRAPAAAPGSAREDLPPKEGRKKKGGGKVIGNETRGNEFSLVVTPGSRGKLGSGKEAPTPKKSRPRRPTRPQPHPHPKSFSSPLSFPAAPAHSVSVGQTSWERAPQTRLQHPSHSISASPTYSIHPRRT